MTTTQQTLSNISSSTRRKIRMMAERVPPEKRQEFIADVADGLKGMIETHPNTITWSLLGIVAGEVIDNAIAIPLPFTEKVLNPLLDHGSTLLGILGFRYGWQQDKAVRTRQEIRAEMAQLIDQALKEHMQTLTPASA